MGVRIYSLTVENNCDDPDALLALPLTVSEAGDSSEKLRIYEVSQEDDSFFITAQGAQELLDAIRKLENDKYID